MYFNSSIIFQLQFVFELPILLKNCIDNNLFGKAVKLVAHTCLLFYYKGRYLNLFVYLFKTRNRDLAIIILHSNILKLMIKINALMQKYRNKL